VALTASVRLWFSRSRQENPADVEAHGWELDTIRSAMLLVMSPCSEAHQARAHYKIDHATSIMALWLLRADLFHYLAQDMGESEAVRRVDGLLPLFANLVPGAAACGKIPDNGTHERNLH